MALARIGRLSPENTVFLLCDVQERFRDVIVNMPSVIAVGQTMIRAASHLDIPVIATEQYPKAFKHTVSEIDMENVPTFSKTKFSMCIPEVENELKKHERQKCVLFGIEAHVCVLQTTMDLIERGYDVHIVADGTSSSSLWERKVAFQRMRTMGAYITTCESLLFQLMGDSKHPRFKDISALIKERRPEPGLMTPSL
mmetsp:Transcript_20085/g.56465  ORF Transcript_20085/g.56465 Transcript_20085/m.56465 type:complete len:197 (+) Transcript_20085:67-657(+)